MSGFPKNFTSFHRMPVVSWISTGDSALHLRVSRVANPVHYLLNRISEKFPRSGLPSRSRTCDLRLRRAGESALDNVRQQRAIIGTEVNIARADQVTREIGLQRVRAQHAVEMAGHDIEKQRRQIVVWAIENKRTWATSHDGYCD